MPQNRALPYTRVSTRYQIPDWSLIHQELKHKGMTRGLLGVYPLYIQ